MKKIRIFSLLIGFICVGACQSKEEQSLTEFPDTSSGQQDKVLIENNSNPVELQTQVDSSRRTAITRAVAAVSPAVVSVTAIKERTVYVDPFFERWFGGMYRKRQFTQKKPTLGSGFIVTPDGYVVTNDHVTGDASEITINTSDGKEYPAHLVGGDFISDIALLKIDDHTFEPAELGTADDLLIGEWAIALGSPFGLFQHNKPTVTVGVISAKDRDFGRIEEGRIYQDMIQTDAAINSGNSGGPLVNAMGQVIGMNTFIYTGDGYYTGSIGIGFAIPIDRIKEIISGLKSDKIDRDFWIGLEYAPLNKFLAREMGYPKEEGIYVARIRHNSPAQKAGVQLGDVIVEVNNFAVNNEKTVDAAMGSDYLKVGDILNIKVWRNEKIIPIKIKLEKRER